MNARLFLFTFSAFFLLSTNDVYGDEIHKESYNGQTLTEKTYTSKYPEYGKRRIYSIDTYTEKVDSIMKTKLPFSIDVKYPTWSSKQSFKDLENYAIKCLSIKGKELAKEYVFDISYLLNDNGEIICYKLWSNKSLYDICTTEEIISIFDEISKFKFPVPVTTWPKESVGYEMMSVELY